MDNSPHRPRARRAGPGFVLALAAAFGLYSGTAAAVPSFARQTGQDCVACHVGGYGPQLTPYGIRFKLGGYTDSDGKDDKVPLSAMLLGGFTRTGKDQPEAPTDRTGRNNNLLLDQASLFVAGRAGEYLGAFVQSTYTGADNKFALDNADVRVAHTLDYAGTELTFGLSVHNTPGIQDPFNTLPAWRFPYVGSSVAPGPAAAPLLDGGLEQHVTGVSAYTFVDDRLYAELGSYRALPAGALDTFGLGRDSYVGKLDSSTVYWRLAYFQDLHKSAFSAGVFGLNTGIDPGDGSGLSDRYRDLGLDAHYQFLGTREHVATVNASYIREHQGRDASFAAGAADNHNGRLNEFNLNASYTYDQTWGLTAGRFLIQGNRDATLYGADSANGSPDSSGYVLQADWTPWGKESSWNAPWANLRVGVQYTMYDRFNGASHNYDGQGANASDNNTLYVFLWTAF